MSLIDQIGAEGFADEADVEARTNFDLNSVTVQTKDVLNLANEKWFYCVNQNASMSRTFSVPGYVTDSTIPLQAETHAAMYTETVTITHSPLIRLSMHFGNAPLISLSVIPSLADPAVGEYILKIDSSVSTEDQDIRTGVFTTVGQLLYVVLRMRLETTTGGVQNNDGIAELFINNELVGSASNVNWSNSATDSVGSGTTRSPQARWQGASGRPHWFRNVSIFDQWTTAPGVAPTLRHVIDGTPSDVTFESGTTWTNEGGAVDEVTALSDQDDTTYVETLEAGAHVVVGFDRPADIATQPTIDALIRTRASRATSAPNTISIATVTDATGVTETQSDDTILTTVGSARENITKALEGVGGTKLFVKVTNGS